MPEVYLRTRFREKLTTAVGELERKTSGGADSDWGLKNPYLGPQERFGCRQKKAGRAVGLPGRTIGSSAGESEIPPHTMQLERSRKERKADKPFSRGETETCSRGCREKEEKKALSPEILFYFRQVRREKRRGRNGAEKKKTNQGENRLKKTLSAREGENARAVRRETVTKGRGR